MTPDSFTAWLAEMKSAGLTSSKAECAILLGVTDDTVTNYQRRGAPRSVALACRALLHRLEPYS